jgi:DHA1 family bicyclomycin/chloramphenicol resistance-like MFS transporter
MHNPLPERQADRTVLLLAGMLAGLAMLGPFSIDTYMPSFPEIGQTFNVTPLQMQLTLSAYLATFSIMMLFHGAISDSFGRRTVILVNLAVFVAASIGCAAAQDFGQLLFFRALQGIAGGVGMVVGRAMIRDTFAGHEAQRMMSMVTMIFGVAPAIAPVIGGWLQAAFGWRSVFVFLTLYSALLLAGCYWRLPETLPHAARQSFAPRALTANYLKVLGSLRFGLLSTAIAFNFAGFFLYIASAPAIIYRLLHLNENQFGWLFIPATSGVILGAFLSGRLAGKLTPRRTLRIAYAIMFTAAALSVGYHLWFPPALPWTVLPVMLYTVGMSLAMPNLTLFVLDLFPRNRGLASSLQGFQQSLFAALVAGAVSPYVAGSGLSLANTSAVLLTSGAVCAFIYSRLPRLEEQRKGNV